MSKSTRVPEIQNISNFRDAGLDGMRNGRLFRSATLDRASGSDIQIMKKSLQIKSIIDLRGPKETLQRKSDQPHVADYYNTVIINADTGASIGLENSIYKINLAHVVRAAVWESTSFLVKLWFLVLTLFGYGLKAQRYIISHSFLANEGLYGLNKAFLKYGGVYLKQVLDIASQSQSYPILIHCSAGKDRTGLSIAILQMLCGVEPEAIIKEYSLSADLLDQALIQKNIAKLGLTPDFSQSNPDVMIKTLGHIEEVYGGVRSFCLSIGCSESQLDRIVENLCRE